MTEIGHWFTSRINGSKNQMIGNYGIFMCRQNSMVLGCIGTHSASFSIELFVITTTACFALFSSVHFCSCGTDS